MRHEPESAAPVETDGNAVGSTSPRRKLLASLPGMVAGTLPALALGAASMDELEQKTQAVIERANAKGLPDTEVIAHTGERMLFHKDLVQDRVVLINFMSIENETEFPVCENLHRLILGLGDSFGRDVIAISVSYDSANDTPERLAEFAQGFGAPEAWHFVTTASPEDAVAVGYKLYRAQGRPRRQMDGDRIHFGNAKIGLWATMSAYIKDVDLAVDRVRSVLPARKVTAVPRRAGPRRLDLDGPLYDHRERPGLA